MTVVVNIGRRVPKSWFRRGLSTIGGLITFQENIWVIIKQSLRMARKKANASKTGVTFVISYDTESEDINYNIEWMKVVIRGTKSQEEEEYNDSMKLYDSLGGIFKKDIPKDKRFSKYFKTTMISPAKLEDAYKNGYGAMKDNNISNKLLEMGILTHIEWVKDFDTRDDF
jgi:hypothetical protein